MMKMRIKEDKENGMKTRRTVMKGKANKIMVVLMGLIVTAMLGACHIEDTDDDDCCTETVTYVEVWEDLAEPAENTLFVGSACDVVCTTEECYPSDYDYSVDTLEFDVYDENIVDLQLDYTLTNYSDQNVFVWVDMCDEIGCENVIEIELFPGETWSERIYNPVLDTTLDEYYDCLYDYGSSCWMLDEVEVWFGEEYTCVPVSLDYHYEGLYVY